MTTPSDLPVTETEREAKDGDNAPGEMPNGSDSSESNAKDLKSLPAWAQQEIAALKSEAHKRRNQTREAEAAAKEQREKNLAEQNEWKTLAEERLTEIGKIKSKAEQFDELSTLFDQQYAAEIKEWPSDLLEMAPSQDAPLTQRLAWLEKARPMAKKLMSSPPSDASAARQPVGGNRRGPEPTTQSLRTQQPSPGNDGPLVDVRRKF